MSVLQISQTLFDSYANVLFAPAYFIHAQSFLVESKFNLDQISVCLNIITDPGLLTMTLYETDKPANPYSPTNIIATATVTPGQISAGAWVDFIFSTPLEVTTGTTYWMMVVPANANALQWNRQSTNVYPNGQRSYFDEGEWSNTTADLTFKVYGNPSFVSPLPTFFR